MTDIISTSLIGLFCTIVSSGATFFFTRRKYNSEVKSQEITNVMNAFEGYKKITEEALSKQADALKKQAEEIERLKAEINRLKDENYQSLMQTLSGALVQERVSKKSKK